MTYFVFLAIFLLIPIVVLLLIALSDKQRGRQRPDALRNWPVWAAIGLHVIIALIYTTPWDNYLVATSVWWYDPQLVTGITLGWVPIEEYTFFILQPILGGLWLLFLMRRMTIKEDALRSSLRLGPVILLGLMWLFSAVILFADWQPGTYLSLILVWALPPIMLQIGFGGDILWRYRRLVFTSIVSTTLYLSLADALAINWGTWTIDPAQSLNIYLGGVLPFEELLFFLVTSTLITFGVVLVMAEASHKRFANFRNKISAVTGDLPDNDPQQVVAVSSKGE